MRLSLGSRVGFRSVLCHSQDHTTMTSNPEPWQCVGAAEQNAEQSVLSDLI